jgi:hypothetical protein
LAARAFNGFAGFPPAVPFISIYVYHTGYVLHLLIKVVISYPVIAIIQYKRRVIGKVRHLERENQGYPDHTQVTRG